VLLLNNEAIDSEWNIATGLFGLGIEGEFSNAQMIIYLGRHWKFIDLFKGG
jgi:hypothetical protein